MCGVAAATLALMAVSTAMSVQSSRNAAKAQSNQLKSEAAIGRTNAVLKKHENDKQTDRIIGRQLSAAGAAGVTSSFGSVPQLAAQTAADGEAQNFVNTLNAELSADAKNASAKNAISAGNAKAAQSVLGFAIKAAGSGAFSGSTTTTDSSFGSGNHPGEQ